MKAPRFSCRYVLLMFNVHRGRVYAVRLLTVTSSQPDAQRRQPGGERASCCMRENFRVDCRATCWLFSQLAPSVLEHRAGKEALCGLERALFFLPPPFFFFFLIKGENQKLKPTSGLRWQEVRFYLPTYNKTGTIFANFAHSAKRYKNA